MDELAELRGNVPCRVRNGENALGVGWAVLGKQ